MRLAGPPEDLPQPTDIAEAIRSAAARLGHRPAITVLRPDRREEQGFASLARWTAKGAHLLELECGLATGDRLRLDAPASWIATAVAYAAWWAGVQIVDSDAPVAVIDETRDSPTAEFVYQIGKAEDGAPVDPGTDEAWPSAVQTFPDQPPAPRASHEAAAAEFATVEGGASTFSHEELLAAAARWGPEGVLGIDADEPPVTWLPAIVRPLLVGRPTVILEGTTRDSAAGENVDVWA